MYFLLFIAVLNILLGVTVFFRNRKNEVNLTFSLIAYCVAIWTLAIFLSWLPSEVRRIDFWSNATFWGPSFIGPLLFYFSLIFPRKKITVKPIYKIALFTPAVLLFFLAIFNQINTKTYNPYTMERGFGIYVFLIYFALVFISALVVLIRNLLTSSGIVKAQLKYVIFGFVGAAMVGIVLNLFFPLALGNARLTIMGPPISGSLFVFVMAYTIVRHRLMDIRMVVARSVAYTILVLTMAAFYALSVLGLERLFFPQAADQLDLAQGAFRTVLAVIMAFSFQPLRRWITKATDRVFFKNQYEPEAFLDKLAHTIGSTIVLIELMYKTLDLLTNELKVTRGIFVALTENGSIFNSQASGYRSMPKLDADDIIRFAKDGVAVYDELPENSRYKHMLRKYDAAVAIPLKTENTTEGVLLLGEKQSGDMFSQTDLRVFEILAPELAVAITNAKSFEKIDRFNVTLRQEIKKATAELEKKNEQLRELDKAKDEFISMASHQLRTPLTAIKGYLSMLLEGDAGEIKVSQYDFVNEAFQGANRMVGLINDLLNVSRMETGRFFLEPVEVDLDTVVQEEIKQLSNHAKEKKLYLKYEKKGKVPKVWADETKIRQVIMNFIDNAVYYTTTGGVTVTLEADKGHVIFKVTDTGIGVPKEQQKNLFTKFYRADNARHVRPDGTGLGIYLAKRVLDDHGGDLIFHSAEGKGSTFGFKFPLNSKLKIKRLAAPAPSGITPGVGELAAGIGVPAETLEATKAVGMEHPLADSSDAEEMAQEVAEQKEKVIAK